MLICQIIASRGDGGLEKHVKELSIALLAKGHQVMVIADHSFLQTLPKAINKHELNMRLSRHNPVLLFKLWCILRKNPADIIHAQANKACHLINAISWLLNSPCIASVHNIKKDFGLFSKFKYVICVSHFLANQVKEQHQTVQQLVQVIYNGISFEDKQASSNHKQLISSKPVLCAIGRLVPAKGFDVLLNAVDGLAIQLIIAGEGPQRRALEDKILKMQTATEVNLIGHCDNVKGLMQSCDGVVISSRREGFSYVLSEALLNSVNVISTDVPVANEVLPKELIVPTDNALALRQKIIECINNKPMWAERMLVAQSIAHNEMTLEKMVNKTVQVYQTALSNKS